MPICYFLPGFSSSSLGRAPGGGNVLWVDYTQIAFGLVGGMRLNAAGTAPGPPDGAQLYPGGPLSDYFGTAVAVLSAQLAPHGYSVRPYGFDWRGRVLTLGAILAQQIRAEVTAEESCSIVAHSLGGLVARAAWSDLVGTGDSNLVRRIVTIGTPHWGSYGIVALLSGGLDTLRQISYLSWSASSLQRAVTPIPFSRPWTVSELIALCATWPSCYQLFPVLGAPGSESDPFRPRLYEAEAWPTATAISAAHLAEAAGAFQTWLKSPESLPPSWVLTTVAGTGLGTFDKLIISNRVGDITSLESVGSGDGQVTTSSALLPESAQYTFQARHVDLPDLLSLSGVLAGLVLNVRNPPDPPPPPAYSPDPVSARFAGPPLPPLNWEQIQLTCAGGRGCC